jgi:hypothetical protein
MFISNAAVAPNQIPLSSQVSDGHLTLGESVFFAAMQRDEFSNKFMNCHVLAVKNQGNHRHG